MQRERIRSDAGVIGSAAGVNRECGGSNAGVGLWMRFLHSSLPHSMWFVVSDGSNYGGEAGRGALCVRGVIGSAGVGRGSSFGDHACTWRCVTSSSHFAHLGGSPSSPSVPLPPPREGSIRPALRSVLC